MTTSVTTATAAAVAAAAKLFLNFNKYLTWISLLCPGSLNLLEHQIFVSTEPDTMKANTTGEVALPALTATAHMAKQPKKRRQTIYLKREQQQTKYKASQVRCGAMEQKQEEEGTAELLPQESHATAGLISRLTTALNWL